MTTPNIKFDRQCAAILGAMTKPEAPEASTLREMVFQTALMDQDEAPEGLMKGLLNAYVAVLVSEDEDDAGVELVNDGPKCSRTYDAEKIWRKYVVAGYIHRLPACKHLDENELYDRCQWYQFDDNLFWPPQLLAEAAYARGVRDALEAEEMAKWATQYEAERAGA